MARTSSFSERPRSDRPRRLSDWLNPTGERKVHSLVDKVYKRKNLELAWKRVKRNKGAGGIDGQTLDVFEEQLVAHLDRLHAELKNDDYRPLPVRQKLIPRLDNRESFARSAYRQSMTGYASRHCRTGWNRSSSRCSMMPALDTDEADRPRTLCARSGQRSKMAMSGSWMRISPISLEP